MRVALVPSAYHPLVGGVEELTRRLAGALSARGDDVEVWTPSVDGAPSHEEVDGISVHRCEMPLPPRRAGPVARFPYEGGRALAELLRTARRFRPDVLHVQCFSRSGVYATAVSYLTRTPIVVTLQGETFMDDHDIFQHSSVLRISLRRALRHASAVTACSAFVLDDARARFGLPPAAGEVVFNGVDLREVEAGSAAIPFARYVVCLGRVVHNKGFDLLLDAFAELHLRVSDVGLVIGGVGAARGALQEQARRLGLSDRVWFPGQLDRAAVGALLRGAEVFVMPSRVEPFGIVILEAWRAGCPVVASSVGGAPEFVRHEVDGLVVDPRDTSALASAIGHILQSGSLAEKLAANGSRRVREFDWSHVADQYRTIYERVVTGGRASPTSSPPPSPNSVRDPVL